MKQLRAEWRRNNCSDLDRVDTILDFFFFSPDIQRELKLQNEYKNPNSMLETLEKVQSEEHKPP